MPSSVLESEAERDRQVTIHNILYLYLEFTWTKEKDLLGLTRSKKVSEKNGEIIQ